MRNQQILRKNTLFNSDLYQFTCSYSYFQSGKHMQDATFEVFFRKYPFNGQYAIFGGLRSVFDFLHDLQLNQEQEQYLRQIFPHMNHEYFTWLREALTIKNLRVKSMREGEFVFAKEPLITYSGPLGVVQLLETPILNLLGFASLVSTNASRMVQAVNGKKCIEFGIRRAQGPDGADTATQFSYLGGFQATSNLNAASKLNIPCVGTMSHAYITSFNSLEDARDFQINGISILKSALKFREQLKAHTHDGELAAFIMYAKAYPHNFTTLIDTYSTLKSGMLNTIIVGKALIKAGVEKIGVRLDSGDLGQQSIECRKLWKEHLHDAPLTIVASDDLHEDRLVEIQQNGSEINVYAIGTNIATCKKQPALGLVCKLVQLDGIPKMKFSEDPGKATYPAKKNVHRIWTNEQVASFDLISMERQEITSPLYAIDPDHPEIKKQFEIKKSTLLNEYWEQPKRMTLKDCRSYMERSKSNFSDVLNLQNPKAYKVYMTEEYMKVFQQTLKKNTIEK